MAKFEKEDLWKALACYNSDEFIVEDEKVLDELYRDINKYGVEITALTPSDGERFSDAYHKVGLTEANNPQKVYVAQAYNQPSITFALAADWDYA